MFDLFYSFLLHLNKVYHTKKEDEIIIFKNIYYYGVGTTSGSSGTQTPFSKCCPSSQVGVSGTQVFPSRISPSPHVIGTQVFPCNSCPVGHDFGTHSPFTKFSLAPQVGVVGFLVVVLLLELFDFLLLEDEEDFDELEELELLDEDDELDDDDE